MRILILPEMCGIACGMKTALEELGHEVTVVGGKWEYYDYPCDIDLSRDNMLRFTARLLWYVPQMRGYDIVWITYPLFLMLKRERLLPIYRYLRRHNKHVVMSALGDDYYYTSIIRQQRPLRHSDWNMGDKERHTDWGDAIYDEWQTDGSIRLTKEIASTCDAIIAAAYEYWVPYHLTTDRDEHGRLLRDKLHMVAMPFATVPMVTPEPSEKLRIFIGISPKRSAYKGTDIMLKAAQALRAAHPEDVELKVAEGVPFPEYQQMMNNSDVMMDQLYSYSPGMNGLLALSKGLITFSGAQPEHYDSLDEHDCRPIICCEPNYESVYEKLEWLLGNRDKWAELKRQSHEYIVRNHDTRKVAKVYEAIFKKVCGE